MLSLTNLKEKKPWFLPKWLWNQLVNAACDAAKENLKIETVSAFVSDAAMSGLQNAIDGEDPKTIEMVCTTVENGGQIFVKAAAAARDGSITPEEKAEVGGAISTTVSALVSQDKIDAKIEEIRSALLFD